MRTYIVLACLVVCNGSFVLAQSVPVNPTALTFDHTDFAATDSYVVGYFSSATATTPVQEAPLPKPASCSPCSGSLPSRPSAFQAWWVAVRAVAGTMTSGWSNYSPFMRVPVAPSNLTLK